MQYNSSENEAVEEEDENNEDQSYSRSTKRPLKSRKEQSRGSIDLKFAADEVVTSALEYFKEKKHDKVPVDADSTFGQRVANSLRAMEDIRTTEYEKFKIQELLFQCSFRAQLQKEHTTPVSHLPNSRPITPLSSPDSAGTASIHQNPKLTQNQQFQRDVRNMRLNSNTPKVRNAQCIAMTSVFRGK